MNLNHIPIRIIPDLTIDDRYAAIVEEAQARIDSFTIKAIKDRRLSELFVLDKSGMDSSAAVKILTGQGRFLVGFQFEAHPENSTQNFTVYVRKFIDGGQAVKFMLTSTVQDIMLQLISLEDHRTVAIFSMLNSSMDVGYRILTTTYGNQLHRLVDKAPSFLQEGISRRLERLAISKAVGEDELWKDSVVLDEGIGSLPDPKRPGSQDNILRVLIDEATSAEINDYVEKLISNSERIQQKRLTLRENPETPPHEIYEQMVRDDLEQLENCYARVHIYLKAFYKNKEHRIGTQNRILRQFFADQVEKIIAETALLEDLLTLSEEEYFMNIARHDEK